MGLRDKAIPLAGDDPGLPDDDLVPVLERLDGARVVGLGEATHGDRESFRFKHRMLQALVRRGGATVLLFERGPAEMHVYDRFVTGENDVLPMGPELRPWRTEEVRDVFRWLREWNAGRDASERVRVAGTVAHSGNGLRLALRLLERDGIPAPASWRRLSEEFPGRLRDLPWVEGALEAWRQESPRMEELGPDGRWIGLLAESFPQWLEVWSGRVPPDRSWVLGDRYMAENALAQLKRFGQLGQPGHRVRAAFWAHNHHLWLEPQRAGAHLRAVLGEKYRVVYSAFGRGAYNASPARPREGGTWESNWLPHPAPPGPAGTLERLLDGVGLECFAIEPGEVPELRRELPVRHAKMVVPDGGEGVDQFYLRCVPSEWVDVIVYFKEAGPTRVIGD